MANTVFLPEGSLIHTEQNTKLLSNSEMLRFAEETETIVEGMATMCDTEHNLIVDLGGIRGIIPREETAIGIEDGSTREIAVISRVGKPVTCIIRSIAITPDKTELFLSRKAAQEKALHSMLRHLTRGDVIPATVTHIEPFGAFVDIGCGNISLIGIETLSVSRISHPSDRLSPGDKILAVVSDIDSDNRRIYLSHRELLGTWEENASKFKVGETVRGIVRGTEPYGTFIELSPNLSGLSEYRGELAAGDAVSVFIKSIIPEKMKIKLVVIDTLAHGYKRHILPEDYFITSGHIDSWQYSPPGCKTKLIQSIFD